MKSHIPNRTRSTPRAGERSAFTLIELLVVIAIIALLAAILFPVFAQIREKARAASCASNEKQLAMGVLQYVQDSDEYPPCGLNYAAIQADGYRSNLGTGWAGQIYPYVRNLNVFCCPDDKQAGTMYPVAASSTVFGPAVDYSYNPNLIGGLDNHIVLMPVARLSSSTQTVLFSETSETRWAKQGIDIQDGEALAVNYLVMSGIYNGHDACAIGTSINGCNSNNGLSTDTGPIGCQGLTALWPSPGGVDPSYPTGRHLNGSNYAFWDGHVKWLQGANVSAGENPNTGSPTWTPSPSLNAVCTAGYAQAGGTLGTMNGAPIAFTMSVN